MELWIEYTKPIETMMTKCDDSYKQASIERGGREGNEKSLMLSYFICIELASVVFADNNNIAKVTFFEDNTGTIINGRICIKFNYTFTEPTAEETTTKITATKQSQTHSQDEELE